MTIATAETTHDQGFAEAALETFGLPTGAYGQILSQDTSITQANDALADATSRMTQIVAVHDDFKVEDLEQYAAFRRRPKGNMATHQIKAFAAYTEAHHGDGTTVFVDADNMRATAVLDFGNTDKPGHCDNWASLMLKNTAAYAALLGATARKTSQRDMAEWMENWAPHITPLAGDEQLGMAKALAAVRNITIEGANRSQHQEESLSTTRSAFESVQAKSDEQLPTFLEYRCRPAAELQERTYVVRISILTGDAKPMFWLNIIALETHQEEAAEEMSGLIRQQIPSQLPVLMGTYTKR